jgi:hypothetical protein
MDQSQSQQYRKHNILPVAMMKKTREPIVMNHHQQSKAHQLNMSMVLMVVLQSTNDDDDKKIAVVDPIALSASLKSAGSDVLTTALVATTIK